MAFMEKLTGGRLYLGKVNVPQVLSGVNVTRAAVLAETEDNINNPGLGSLYLASDRAYLRVNNANANTDWEKITTSAAD